jgi:hypothetical protein
MVSFQVVKGRDQANKALNALSQERLGVCVSYFHSSCNPKCLLGSRNQEASSKSSTYACFRSAFTTGFRMQNR